MTENDYLKICNEKFKYLYDEYDFKFYKLMNDKSSYCLFLLNEFVGVKLVFEFGDFYFYIYFCKLVSGEFMNDSLNIDENIIIYNYNFENLLTIRDFDSPILKYYEFVIDKNIIEIIDTFAKSFKINSSDILSGDLRIMEQLDKIIKKRLQ